MVSKEPTCGYQNSNTSHIWWAGQGENICRPELLFGSTPFLTILILG
jgi:hypothetical protein